MRNLSLSLLLLLMAACGNTESDDAMDAGAGATSASASASASSSSTASADVLPDSAVRHVVVFRYSEAATEVEIERVSEAFGALEEKIPGILAFERGINHSPEGLNQGFTHVYTLTFVDAAARDAYLPHPEHTAFGSLLEELGIVEEVFVVDYTPVP